VVPIVYGLFMEPLDDGDVEYAGCKVPLDPPAHRCRACRTGFGDNVEQPGPRP
jgi:hypothetical protein